jgi:hypothetical protein
VGQETRPIGRELRPIGRELRPMGHQPRPVGHELRPVGHQPRPVGRELRPVGRKTRPAGQKMVPLGQRTGPLSGEHRQLLRSTHDPEGVARTSHSHPQQRSSAVRRREPKERHFSSPGSQLWRACTIRPPVASPDRNPRPTERLAQPTEHLAPIPPAASPPRNQRLRTSAGSPSNV